MEVAVILLHCFSFFIFYVYTNILKINSDNFYFMFLKQEIACQIKFLR